MAGFQLVALYQEITELEQRFQQFLSGGSAGTTGVTGGVPQPGSPWYASFLEDYARVSLQSRLQLQTCNQLERYIEPPSSESTPLRRYFREIMMEAKDRAMGQCALLERMLRRLLEAGEACMGNGRPEEALELYRFGLRLSPEASLLRFGECRALSCLGQESEAEKALDKALAGCPVASVPGDEEQAVLSLWMRRALLAVGNHLYCNGNWSGACQAYEAVLKSDPSYEPAYTRLEAMAVELETAPVPASEPQELETLPAADNGVIARFAEHNYWTPFFLESCDQDNPATAAGQIRALSGRYSIRRRNVQPEIELHSPRIMHPDGCGGLYVCDCYYAETPNRLLRVDLRTGETRLLSEQRFYTGLWLERNTGLLYGSLAALGRERACKLDCMDAEGALQHSVDIDTPAYGAVGGPFRIAEDGLGGLLLLDTKKQRLLRYALRDFSDFQEPDLSGWSVTPDLAVVPEAERIYLVCPGQNTLLELSLRFGPGERPQPVRGPQLHQPYRITADQDAGLLYVVCSEELVVLEKSFRIRYRYPLPPEPVRDICLLLGEVRPSLALIQEMRGIFLLEPGA